MTSSDPTFQFVWIIWASAFLAPWAALYVFRPHIRAVMLRASLLTMPFGLTEPIFVPSYWNPPSLFGLAQSTGFDIESLIFCFAIGGIGVVGYRIFLRASNTGSSWTHEEKANHRFHRIALISPFFIFAGLVVFSWNPIYPSIAALLIGSMSTILCRPELTRNALVGGLVFLLIYVVYLTGLRLIWPGYIEAVWAVDELLAWRPFGFPIEELLFGFGFGMYWSTVYEHLTWKHLATGVS